MQRIRSLDSLRGIACLIVMLAHIIASNQSYGIYANGCGKIGVWCFFILSGFLSFLPYTEGRIFFFHHIILYYLKKIKKLYPTYIVALFVALFLGFLSSVTDIGKHILCLEGIGHFWYMPVIIKFYLIFPVILVVYQILSEKYFYCLIFLLGLLLTMIFPFVNYIENSISIFWYLPVFFMGILLAYPYKKLKTKNKKFLDVFGDAVAIGSVCVLVLLTPLSRELIWKIAPSNWLQNKYLIIGFLWAIFMLAILSGGHIRGVLERSRSLQWLGQVSYEVYLFHYLVLWKLVQYCDNTVMLGFEVVISSLLIAALLQKVKKYGLSFS